MGETEMKRHEDFEQRGRMEMFKWLKAKFSDKRRLSRKLAVLDAKCNVKQGYDYLV